METLLALFQTYGYYLLFVALLLENTILLGLFLPGETLLVGASALAGRGFLRIETVIIVAIAAALLGQNIGYFLGRRGGRPLLERFGHRFFMDAERLRATEEYFNQHGGKTVFIGRFAAGIRVFIPLIAGVSHMSFSRFFGYTLAAVIAWTVTIASLGYLLSDQWETVSRVLGNVGWLVVVVVGALLALFYWRRRKARAQGHDSRPRI